MCALATASIRLAWALSQLDNLRAACCLLRSIGYICVQWQRTSRTALLIQLAAPARRLAGSHNRQPLYDQARLPLPVRTRLCAVANFCLSPKLLVARWWCALPAELPACSNAQWLAQSSKWQASKRASN